MYTVVCSSRIHLIALAPSRHGPTHPDMSRHVAKCADLSEQLSAPSIFQSQVGKLDT